MISINRSIDLVY